MKHAKGQVCAELQAQLPDYLDGEAKEAICRAIEEHLASCEDCRVVIDTMKKTIALYRVAPRDEVPAEIHHRLVQVLRLDDVAPPPDK